MPAKFVKTAPQNAIFVLKNTETGEFYAYGFKSKEKGAKPRRNDLNADHIKALGLEGVSPKNGPWVVTKGPAHPLYVG